MPTPAQYLSDLAAAVPDLEGPIGTREVGAFLLHAIQRLTPLATSTAPPVGLVILVPATTVVGVTILHVSQRVLTDLVYPSQAAYTAAVAGGSFVHVDDLEVTTSHLRDGSPTVYDSRFLRGDGGGYREMRVQGGTIALPGIDALGIQDATGPVRLSLLWRP